MRIINCSRSSSFMLKVRCPPIPALCRKSGHLYFGGTGHLHFGPTGQRLMSGILSTRLFELPTPLLVLPGVSSAQVSWRPNIFGGQDCIGPEGRSSSTPNVFRAYGTPFPDGSRSSSHPNVFGDQDTTTPKGTLAGGSRRGACHALGRPTPRDGAAAVPEESPPRSGS